MVSDDPCNIEEQRSPRIVESLSLSCQRKRLARKPCQQYIMARNLSFIDLRDIANHRKIILEVRRIRRYRFFVQLARKDRFHAAFESLLETEPYSSDAGK